MLIRLISITFACIMALSACTSQVAEPPVRRVPGGTTHYDVPHDGPVTPNIPNRLDLAPFVSQPCALLEHSDLKSFAMGPGDHGEPEVRPRQGDCDYRSKATDRYLLIRLYSDLNVLSGRYQDAK